jgi:phage host-nuclease inhibitor protein Gam
MKSLEEILFSEQPEGERFRIENEQQLDWALRKIKEAEKELKEIQRQRDEYMEKINAWFADAAKEHNSTIERMTGLVTEYHMGILSENPKKKTIKRPLGTISARTTDKFDYDEDILVEHLKENQMEDLLKVKYSVDKTAVKAHFKETGELLPGLRITPEHTTFKVKIKEDEE